jgi:glyoxylase-like metal-dependent hydrolase (beta-lactamase superfamily II)
MLTSSDRRDFLRMCTGAAVGLSVPFSLRGGVSIEAAKLSDNLLLISGAGANVILVIGSDGLAMVDGGLPERSAELLSLVVEHGQSHPVQLLFNTNWHLTHTGSNETLGKAGAKIVAHANTRKWLRTRVFIETENRTYERRAPEAIPTDTFYTSAKLSFGQAPIEYGHLPFGNSDGDIYVFFPQSNVMVVSDILSVGQYPNMDYSTGGWIGGIVEAGTVLLKMIDNNTRVVPALGPVQTKEDLKAEHDMAATVGNRMIAMLQQGKGYHEMIASAPTKEFDARWGRPDQFLNSTYKGLLRNLEQLNAVRL